MPSTQIFPPAPREVILALGDIRDRDAVVARILDEGQNVRVAGVVVDEGAFIDRIAADQFRAEMLRSSRFPRAARAVPSETVKGAPLRGAAADAFRETVLRESRSPRQVRRDLKVSEKKFWE